MALPIRYAEWWVKNAQALTVIFCGLSAPGSLIGAFTAAVRGDWASVAIALAVLVAIAAIILSPLWGQRQLARRDGHRRSDVMPWDR